MQTVFYVYQWYNTETKEVFYVGKGCGDRYKNKKDRNKLFLQYIANNQVDSEIVKYFDSEEEAFSFEKELTEFYRSEGMCQCNLIDGGYGGYSKVWTNAMREYMSKYNPMKSDTQRKRMVENNPMKDTKIAIKTNAQKKRPVVIDGVLYSGIVDAASILGVWENTILNWCKRGYDTNGKPCHYENEKQKEYIVKRTNSKGIFIDNIYYASLKEAAKALNIKDTSPLCRALKAGKPYKGHICKYANQQPSASLNGL